MQPISSLTLSTAILGVALWQNGQVGGAVYANCDGVTCKCSFSLDYVESTAYRKYRGQ